MFLQTNELIGQKNIEVCSFLSMPDDLVYEGRILCFYSIDLSYHLFMIQLADQELLFLMLYIRRALSFGFY